MTAKKDLEKLLKRGGVSGIYRFKGEVKVIGILKTAPHKHGKVIYDGSKYYLVKGDKILSVSRSQKKLVLKAVMETL